MLEIHESLDELLDVPVSRMNGNLLPAADPDALSYTTAIGVALGADGSGLGRINLIPQSRTDKKIAAQRRIQTVIGGVVAIAAVAAGAVFLSGRISAQRVEHAQALRENDKLKKIQVAATRVKTEHDSVAKAYQIVANSLGRDKPAVDVIKAVSDTIPKTGGIYLTQLSFDRSGAVAIHGITKSETAATDFVLALQASDVFVDVRLPYMGDAQSETTPAAAATTAATKPKSGENMSFIISCRIKGMSKLELDRLTSTRSVKPAAQKGTE
jgi:Tfp pilus assembly protein PilN